MCNSINFNKDRTVNRYIISNQIFNHIFKCFILYFYPSFFHVLKINVAVNLLGQKLLNYKNQDEIKKYDPEG